MYIILIGLVLCAGSVNALRIGYIRPNHVRSTIKMSSDVGSSVPAKTSLEIAQKRAVKGKSFMRCKPIGIGAKPGQQVMRNEAFEKLVETSDAWISKRTGIRRRHILAANSTLREISIQAANDALHSAGVEGKDIDLVIVCTSSPDDLFGDAASVASAIGAKHAAAFDLTAACAGFLYGLVTASQFMHSGAYRRVLLVGADALTRFLDWSDRGTCILFGDGAGAMVLEATDNDSDAGLLGFALHSNGEGYHNLRLPFKPDFKPPKEEDATAETATREGTAATQGGGGDTTLVDKGNYANMYMNGAEVYKFAVSVVPEVVAEALTNAGLVPSDLDWLLLHQANIRIMESAAAALGIDMDKVLRNIDEYGNTSAASIPLALAEAVAAGKVKEGDLIAVSGFGAGLSWGAAVIRWGGKGKGPAATI